MINFSHQVHLLETHAVQFLEMKGEEHGLGYYSEQAMESFHHEMKEEWQADKVDVKHPKYGKKLKCTTVRMNGKHI